MKSVLWLAVYFAVLVWSGIHPKDYTTWLLEVLPAILGLAVMIVTRQRFPLTGITYQLILLHCIILMIGGHYTYAEVPLFDWIRDWSHGTRNNYDKVGHFAQGFVPALIARELVIRKAVITDRGWRFFFIVCFCLAFSAFYELIEWWVAIAIGQDADAFLGTQGYHWDTQSDMALALLGAILSLSVLSPWHDRQLNALDKSTTVLRPH